MTTEKCFKIGKLKTSRHTRYLYAFLKRHQWWVMTHHFCSMIITLSDSPIIVVIVFCQFSQASLQIFFCSFEEPANTWPPPTRRFWELAEYNTWQAPSTLSEWGFWAHRRPISDWWAWWSPAGLPLRFAFLATPDHWFHCPIQIQSLVADKCRGQ